MEEVDIFLCDICGKEFKSQKALYGHMAQCNKEDNKEVCPICGNSYSKANIYNHIKSHEKDHPCLNCGKMLHGVNKFCNSSCSASYNNHKRAKNEICVCLNCGKEYVKSKNSTGKFCCFDCSVEFRNKEKDKEYFKGEISDMHTLKRHYIRNNEYKCAICGISEWNNKPLVLILDHIDGNSDNNFPNNLRLVCPNCDSQLDTFKGKNKGNGRFFRRQRYKENKSY